MDVAPSIATPRHPAWSCQCCTGLRDNAGQLQGWSVDRSTHVTAILHTQARLWPIGLARAIQGAVISWHEIHKGHHRFEAVLDLSPAALVIAAAGIFHAVHVGCQSVTATCAAAAAGKVARVASTALEDSSKHGHEGHRYRLREPCHRESRSGCKLSSAAKTEGLQRKQFGSPCCTALTHTLSCSSLVSVSCLLGHEATGATPNSRASHRKKMQIS